MTTIQIVFALSTFIYRQVPTAIKAMYHQPLGDGLKAPCLTELLVTATEELEALRREGERERKIVGKDISPAPITTSEEQDKVDDMILLFWNK